MLLQSFFSPVSEESRLSAMVNQYFLTGSYMQATFQSYALQRRSVFNSCLHELQAHLMHPSTTIYKLRSQTTRHMSIH